MNSIRRIYILCIACAFFPLSAYSNDGIIQQPVELEEITVSGFSQRIAVQNQSLSVVTRNQIEERRNPSLLPVITEQVPALFTTARGVMGYSVANGSAGSMTIRGIGGSPTSGVLVLINARPQFMGLMGHPLADTYQTMMAERVEVITGPASAQYGSNAMGGVINIVTRKPLKDTVLTNTNLMYGSYNTFSAGANSSIRKGKFNSFVALDYGRTDGHRKNMDFEQLGAYAQFGYDFSKKWQTSADINITNFNTSNPGTVAVPMFDNDMDILRGTTSFSLTNKHRKTSGALQFFYNFGDHEINEGYTNAANRNNIPLVPRDYLFHSKDYMTGVSAYQYISIFNGRSLLTAKFDYQHFGGRVMSSFFDDRPTASVLDKTMNNIAGYLGLYHRFSWKFFADAGLRADYNQYFEKTQWIPHASLNYILNSNTQVRTTVSKGFRYPTIRELFYLPPRNPDLQPERLMNYEISATQDLLNKKLNLGLNLYYIKGDNSIQTVFAGGAPRFMNTGKVENYGLEISSQYRINQHFNISANYAWLNMEHKVIASPEHKLYAGVNYARQKWSASSGAQFVSGLYTELGNNPQTESFVLWNARASYRANRILEIFAKGENLLNQKYEINAGFPMPGATVFGGVNLTF